MESTGRFLEAGLVELNGGGEERGEGGKGAGMETQGGVGWGLF